MDICISLPCVSSLYSRFEISLVLNTIRRSNWGPHSYKHPITGEGKETESYLFHLSGHMKLIVFSRFGSEEAMDLISCVCVREPGGDIHVCWFIIFWGSPLSAGTNILFLDSTNWKVKVKFWYDDQTKVQVMGTKKKTNMLILCLSYIYVLLLNCRIKTELVLTYQSDCMSLSFGPRGPCFIQLSVQWWRVERPSSAGHVNRWKFIRLWSL